MSEDDSRHSDCYIKRGRDCDNDWNIRRIHGLRTYSTYGTVVVLSVNVPFHYAGKGSEKHYRHFTYSFFFSRSRRSYCRSAYVGIYANMQILNVLLYNPEEFFLPYWCATFEFSMLEHLIFNTKVTLLHILNIFISEKYISVDIYLSMRA